MDNCKDNIDIATFPWSNNSLHILFPAENIFKKCSIYINYISFVRQRRDKDEKIKM